MAIRKSVLLLGTILTAGSAPCFSNAAHAQSSAAPYQSATRYDAMGRVTGTIGADPDGTGPLRYRAVRNRYDGAGRLIRVERGTLLSWQPETVAPADWGAAFTPLESVETRYDAMDRKTHETHIAGGAAHSLTQTSYDALGRVECIAVRMNVYAFGALPASACTPGPEMGHGPDRITRNAYDAAGQLVQVREGVGSPIEAAEVTYSYDGNGQRRTVIDGNGNRAELRYDGFGRQDRWVFPSAGGPPAGYDGSTPERALATAGAVNEGDYEAYGRDRNGNIVSRRLRSGETLVQSHDALNRLVHTDNPHSGSALNDTDRWLSYDLLGRMVRAWDGNGHFVERGYNGFGEVVREASLTGGTKLMTYDAEGRRTRLTYADGPSTGSGGAFFVTYDYLATDEMTHIREEGAQSGPGVLATFAYDDLGRRTYLTRGNGVVTSYGYHASGLPSHLGHHIQAAGQPIYEPFSYFSHNAAGQIIHTHRNNDDFAVAPASGNVSTPADGLNRIANVGGNLTQHDGRGNMTGDGTWSMAINGPTAFGYNLLNQLTAHSNGTQLYYDPLGRLSQQWVTGGGGLDYVGGQLVAETSGWFGSRRHVHGPGVDEPLVTYENAGGGWQRRHLHADERGSIVMLTDDAANVTFNRYDEYGVVQGGLSGRFGFTGQAWLPEIGRYYFKTRTYNPVLGRFDQTDTAGYVDGPNLYPYAGGDPVNLSDTDGRQPESVMDRRNQALSQAGRECEGQSAACGNAILQGIGVAVQALAGLADILNTPVSPGPDLSIVAGIGRHIAGAPREIVERARGGLLPRRPPSPGLVPRDQRDARRTWSAAERAARREEQGGRCANGCGTQIDASNSRGHHIDRHADGGRTNRDNHAEVCIDCHKDIHSPR